MTFDPHALKIYIDGSALKNPGVASGFAGRAEYPENWNRADEVLFTLGYGSSTNNRMELLACVTAMEHICDNVIGVQRVQIVTDSRYVHDNIPRAEGWRHNDWKNQYDRPIENADLWLDSSVPFGMSKICSALPADRMRADDLLRRVLEDDEEEEDEGEIGSQLL